MLSRVAERIYWLARYMERAENTARLVNVNAHLLLDLPSGVTLGWAPLIDISGGRGSFDELYEEATERNVVRFLIADARNPSSLSSSILFARENARTIRDIIPSEAWETINDLHDLCKEALPAALSRKKRYHFLQQVINRVQQVTGLLAGTMLHNVGYDFLRLGRNLERADMTSRIVDVRAESILTSETEDLAPFEQVQWVSVLHSMSAYQGFRQEVQGIIRRDIVLQFLLHNRRFPRSFAHCIEQIKDCLGLIPHGKKLVQHASTMLEHVESLSLEQISDKELYLMIDEMQVELAELHKSISETYFSLNRKKKKVIKVRQSQDA